MRVAGVTARSSVMISRSRSSAAELCTSNVAGVSAACSTAPLTMIFSPALRAILSGITFLGAIRDQDARAAGD
jgi:hypothetical protein